MRNMGYRSGCYIVSWSFNPIENSRVLLVGEYSGGIIKIINAFDDDKARSIKNYIFSHVFSNEDSRLVSYFFNKKKNIVLIGYKNENNFINIEKYFEGNDAINIINILEGK